VSCANRGRPDSTSASNLAGIDSAGVFLHAPRAVTRKSALFHRLLHCSPVARSRCASNNRDVSDSTNASGAGALHECIEFRVAVLIQAGLA
jgi:hypothetical protein